MAVLVQFRNALTNWTLRGGTADPNTALEPGAVGDWYARTGAAQARMYVNSDGTPNGWVETGALSWTATQALTWTLVDNTIDALQIGSAGLAGLLSFNTNNGAEFISYGGGGAFVIGGGGLQVNAGLLLSPHLAFPNYAVGTPGVKLLVEVAHPGGNVDGNVVLPARANGWRVLDAKLRSEGATAGTITPRTAAAGGGNAVTNALVPGNANVLTRATSVIAADQVFAGGATIFCNGAGNPPATSVQIELVGL